MAVADVDDEAGEACGEADILESSIEKFLRPLRGTRSGLVARGMNDLADGGVSDGLGREERLSGKLDNRGWRTFRMELQEVFVDLLDRSVWSVGAHHALVGGADAALLDESDDFFRALGDAFECVERSLDDSTCIRTFDELTDHARKLRTSVEGTLRSMLFVERAKEHRRDGEEAADAVALRLVVVCRVVLEVLTAERAEAFVVPLFKDAVGRHLTTEAVDSSSNVIVVWKALSPNFVTNLATFATSVGIRDGSRDVGKHVDEAGGVGTSEVRTLKLGNEFGGRTLRKNLDRANSVDVVRDGREETFTTVGRELATGSRCVKNDVGGALQTLDVSFVVRLSLLLRVGSRASTAGTTVVDAGTSEGIDSTKPSVVVGVVHDSLSGTQVDASLSNDCRGAIVQGDSFIDEGLDGAGSCELGLGAEPLRRDRREVDIFKCDARGVDHGTNSVCDGFGGVFDQGDATTEHSGESGLTQFVAVATSWKWGSNRRRKRAIDRSNDNRRGRGRSRNVRCRRVAGKLAGTLTTLGFSRIVRARVSRSILPRNIRVRCRGRGETNSTRVVVGVTGENRALFRTQRLRRTDSSRKVRARFKSTSTDRARRALAWLATDVVAVIVIAD